jgi:nucleoside-diphosphate-sugar epimerase
MVYVDDVADQFLALLTAPCDRFEHRRFFNTGGDTCSVRELAETVRRLAPGARIEVRSAGERDIAGLVTRVTDRALEETLGVRRGFTPLEVGLRAHIEVARRRAGQGLAGPGEREP